MQSLDTKPVETQSSNESLDTIKKNFTDNLRKKFHNANPDCTLQQLQSVDKNLKAITQTVESLFGADSQKVFKLLSDIPANMIENFSKFGVEIINSISKDLKEDVNSLEKQEFKSGYMDLIIKQLGIKQQTAQNKEQAQAIIKTEERKDIGNKNFEKNKQLFLQALKDKQAVQADPATSKHFKTDEYRLKRQNIEAEMQARPDLKATLQAKFGANAPTMDDLADMVATKLVIQEKGINTTATQNFVKSYNYLDDALHFGTYNAKELGKNDNILQNSNYQKLIDKKGSTEVKAFDFSKPDLKIKALELASKQKPGLFNQDFISKYKQAIMQKDDNGLKKLQNENPEQFEALNQIEQNLNTIIAQLARVEVVRSYNGFIGGLFNGEITGKDGGNAVNIKTSDEKLKIDEDSMTFEITFNGKDCKFEVRDGKLYMTNLFNKDKLNNTFKIGTDEIPLNGANFPSIKEILDEVYLSIQQEGTGDLLDTLNGVDDLGNMEAKFGPKIKEKINIAIKKLSNNAKPEEIASSVCNYTEKYYYSSKLLTQFVPPNYEYTFANKQSPAIRENDKKNGLFYSYLDALKNTFYDEASPAPASKMKDFSNKLEELFSTKAITPEKFFAQFGNAQETQNGFVCVRPMTNEKYIDLTKFDEYAKQLTAKQA